MHAFTRVDLNCREQAGAVVCTTRRHDGWFELYALPAFALLVVLMFWSFGTLLTRVTAIGACFVVAASTLALRLQGNLATLEITSEQIIARGNLGRWFRTLIRIPVSTIRTVHFSTGREGEHSGIYVLHGWRRTCLLPRIDAAQGEEITAAIRMHVPSIQVGPSDSSLPLRKRVLASLHLIRAREGNTTH